MAQLPTFASVEPINPALPYFEGKRLLAKRLCVEINQIPHRVYVEPFCGMGGVFFRRTNRPKAETINDLIKDVSNFFRVVRKHNDAMITELKYHITCRDEFERLKHTSVDVMTDVERAARFFYLQRCCYGGRITKRTLGVSANGQAGRFSSSAAERYIDRIHNRLQGVVIEALPYADILRRYDSPSTLFYLDPPYWGCENDYGKGLFCRTEFEQLAEQLADLKGRFIMSINDVPEIRDKFRNFKQQVVLTTYSCGQSTSKRANELIIQN